NGSVKVTRTDLHRCYSPISFTVIRNSIVTNKSAKVLMGRVCNNEYTSKAKAALPDNDSLMMFLTISSFSLKDRFSICTSD
ncbi:hypothetical protein NQ246_24270, partial [Escherichia coli]|nr:hypothetical protein [Escherichia coli]